MSKDDQLIWKKSPIDNECDEKYSQSNFIKPEIPHCLQGRLTCAHGCCSAGNNASSGATEVNHVTISAFSGFQFRDFSEKTNLFFGKGIVVGCSVVYLINI